MTATVAQGPPGRVGQVNPSHSLWSVRSQAPAPLARSRAGLACVNQCAALGVQDGPGGKPTPLPACHGRGGGRLKVPSALVSAGQ